MKRRLTLGAVALLGVAACQPAEHAGSVASNTPTVAITLPFTGADAEDALHLKNGIAMAFDEVNATGGAGGIKIETVQYDNGTARAGKYDPEQAAANARKLVADPRIVAVVGPMMSGEGKTMSPILSEANLAAVTPSSTNPDITNPNFTALFRPRGKAIYFRTLTTDALQGPNMANWMKDRLRINSVYVLDDGGAYGKGVADSFQKQAAKIGLKVLGRDRLDPNQADYTAILTKIKALNADALYYGGVGKTGVPLAKKAYEIMPSVIKAGADGMLGQSVLKGVGFPALEGWYATTAPPHLTEDHPAVAAWLKRYRAKFPGQGYDDYTITAYDAALVVADAIKRVVASGDPVNRDTMRDAIQQTKLKTLQGDISFDANGDMVNKVISVFQYRENKAFPIDDYPHQVPYVGAAPETPQS
ncbi:MAG TPA: branched-chain amino acid ABC transporter substrate-binding protein [Stellaceae bacterium]|jgi:branched-chain amino acid transport system substrate-binding protein|nr:branched-chain amino acid ABC transporter substrate-binding protein [Stellaceae bacterium]